MNMLFMDLILFPSEIDCFQLMQEPIIIFLQYIFYNFASEKNKQFKSDIKTYLRYAEVSPRPRLLQ